MKYFLGFLASIALVVVVFFLVFRGLTGGGDEAARPKVDALQKYANTQTVMRLTVDGPLQAEQEHDAYEITVGREDATIEIYQGYERTQTAIQTYDNTVDNYRQFLGALERAGFNLGNTEDKDRNPVGVCPFGMTIKLEIISGASQLQNFWTTNCDEKGTFRGATPQIMQLFRDQIPDYSKLTRRLDLR